MAAVVMMVSQVSLVMLALLTKQSKRPTTPPCWLAWCHGLYPIAPSLQAIALHGPKIGSLVQLWGNKVPVDEIARMSDTIGYELLCAVAPRVPVEIK